MCTFANIFLFPFYGHNIVQDVENFFGNVKDVRMNTYYELDTTISLKIVKISHYSIKEAIRFCLQEMSQHPPVPRLPAPPSKRHVKIWTFENDEYRYIYENSSGQCINPYGNFLYAALL